MASKRNSALDMAADFVASQRGGRLSQCPPDEYQKCTIGGYSCRKCWKLYFISLANEKRRKDEMKTPLVVEFKIHFAGKQYGWNWFCLKDKEIVGGYSTSTKAKLSAHAHAHARKIGKWSGRPVEVKFSSYVEEKK